MVAGVGGGTAAVVSSAPRACSAREDGTRRGCNPPPPPPPRPCRPVAEVFATSLGASPILSKPPASAALIGTGSATGADCCSCSAYPTMRLTHTHTPHHVARQPHLPQHHSHPVLRTRSPSAEAGSPVAKASSTLPTPPRAAPPGAHDASSLAAAQHSTSADDAAVVPVPDDLDPAVARALQAFEQTFGAELNESCDRLFKASLAAAVGEVRRDYVELRDEVRQEAA